MAIHWTIPFCAFRSGIVYNINIHDADYSGQPIVLSGGSVPLVTQEDDDDDFFCNIRTQSGSLRIIDNGKDAEGNALPANWWKSFVPDSDTSRPITVTHRIGRDFVVEWQGFIQAQNFGFTLFGDPQEKEFPIQCALTVLEGSDVDKTHVEIENFAYLLRECLNEIDRLSGGTITNHEVTDAGVVHIDNIYVQGGADALTWLLKRVDWQNFVTTADDVIEARYTLYEALQDMCRYWGWTARTYGTDIYLIRADDTGRTGFIMLTRAQLSTMANGNSAGFASSFRTATLTGEEFVSMDNIDYRQRGHNKATVNADCGEPASDNIVVMDEKLGELLLAQGLSGETHNKDGVTARYYNDLMSFNRPFLTGTARSTYGSFAMATIGRVNEQGENVQEIRIKKSFSSISATAYAQFATVYHHAYSGGVFQFFGHTYRYTEQYEETDDFWESDIGKKHMYVRLGVGKTRATAKWYDGREWQSSEKAFLLTIGNAGDVFYAKKIGSNFWRGWIPSPDTVGLLFVEFLGSDDLDAIDGERSFELTDFSIAFSRDANIRLGVTPKSLPGDLDYTSRNQNNVRDEWNADCIYASDNNMAFGFGLIINPDGTFMKTAPYGSEDKHPEQQLADRVTAYWSSARRMVSINVMSNDTNVDQIRPDCKAELDGDTFYPITISRYWRDDTTELTMLELPVI